MTIGLSNRSYPDSISNSKYYLVLFLIWPFLSFILALINYSQKEAKKVVYIFLIYYGFTFVNNNIYVDAYRYAKNLEAHALLPFSDFGKIVGGLYTDTSLDIVEPLISFIVSRFTDFHGIYFAVWAAIFGFFYLKSINLLYNRYRENPGWQAMILMIFFIIIAPITLISTVRMWTAAWIFFYGAYHVILKRDPRYLILALGASLFHWSFISANAILIIYYFLGNRNIIYLPLTLVSFVVPQFAGPIIQSLSLRLGGAFQGRYEGYSSTGYILAQEHVLEQSSWFLKIGTNLVFYFLLIAIIIIQYKTWYTKKEMYEKNLFSFLLLFLAFVNFALPIPSFGARFQVIFFLFAIVYILNYVLQNRGKVSNLLSLAGMFPMVLYAAITFRTSSESISSWLFSPGLGLPLLGPGTSLASLIFN